MTGFKSWKHIGKELEGSKDAPERIPHPLVCLIPFVVLAVTLTFIVRCFGADSLAGASQVALLFSASLAATITSVLIPWNSCGMTQSTVLKVPTLDYLPYCIFNLLSPVISVIVAATGYRIFKLKTNTEKNNSNI